MVSDPLRHAARTQTPPTLSHGTQFPRIRMLSLICQMFGQPVCKLCSECPPPKIAAEIGKLRHQAFRTTNHIGGCPGNVSSEQLTCCFGCHPHLRLTMLLRCRSTRPTGSNVVQCHRTIENFRPSVKRLTAPGDELDGLIPVSLGDTIRRRGETRRGNACMHGWDKGE